jgi:hypothetical protein
MGSTLGQVHTFEPFHPATPDHVLDGCWHWTRVFLHFKKPVSDPSARVQHYCSVPLVPAEEMTHNL